MNMKLSNISLAVLVALGLVACGGSNSNDDQTKDKDTQVLPDKDTDKTDNTPKIENNGKEVPKDPRRAAPGMSVEKNVASITAVNKQLYIDRQSRDAIAGYNGDAGEINVTTGIATPLPYPKWQEIVGKTDDVTMGIAPFSNSGITAYNPGSTNAKDILRASSIYNYYEVQKEQNSLNKDGGIHANPNFSYAKGDDGKFYRVKPAGNTKWNEITSETKFEVVNPGVFGTADKYGLKNGKGAKIPMTEVVFIPNALNISYGDNAGEDKVKANEAYIPGGVALTGNAANRSEGGINVLDPNNIVFFNINRGNVLYKSFDLAGVHYDLKEDFNTNNIPLDLSKVKVKREIQQHDITLNYVVENNQSTATLNDDDIVNKTAKVGAMKLYNLPYSRSSITINQQAVENAGHVNAAPNNFFNLANSGSGHYGAFQVVGFQTNSLPRDGRADYVGKSYGVNSEGDLELRADFAINRAGIHGAVINRKTVDSSKRPLADLTLQEINLSTPGFEYTASNGMQSTSIAADGDVSIGGRGAGKWAVALYGPNAEEVGGVIDLNSNGTIGVNDGKNFEVFSGQRGSLILDSLNPGKGN